jgi:hypothetical protein
MTPSVAAALASACLVLAAAPAMAQSNIGMLGGHAGGGHAGGGRLGGFPHPAHPIAGAPGVGRGDGHFGPGGGFAHRRFAHDGHGHGNGNGDVFVYGYDRWPYGGYGWYPGPADYGYEEAYAEAPAAPPAPPSGYHYYDHRHDPNACAEWNWVAGKRRYVCARHAS